MTDSTKKKPKYRSLEQAVHLELLAPLGEQIKRLRNSRGITQEELADRIGKGKSVIAKYERGNVNLRIGVLAQVAQALDCKFEIILTPFEHLKK